MSANKPTRHFTICTGPIIAIGEKEPYEIQPVLLHQVRGCEVKYIAAPDAGFMHIVDAQGSVVFSTPTQSVLWIKQEKPAEDPLIRRLTIVQ